MRSYYCVLDVFFGEIFPQIVLYSVVYKVVFMMRQEQEKKPRKPTTGSRCGTSNWKHFLASNPRNAGHSRKYRQGRVGPSELSAEKLISELVGQNHSSQIMDSTKVLGLDCEMVGVATSPRDMLARVSIVDSKGECIYDKYVTPTEEVTDYRTWVSGIRPKDLLKGEPFDKVRVEVLDILSNAIVVGHAITHDFRALHIKHPKHLIRDTSTFPIFCEMFSNKTPSLRNLARAVLGVNIQSGEHSSVQDARATVQLYMAYREEWEDYVGRKFSRSQT